jgi:hypothetical protein
MYELGQHRTCGLANGDNVDCRRASEGVSDRRFGKRGTDEHGRISGTNG